MKLWLDDVRPPWKYGYIGYTWAKTCDEAIAFLKTGNVTFISLDHDLSEKATMGDWENEKTGYTVVCWMEENNVWPINGCQVHSMNPVGAKRMLSIIAANYDTVPVQVKLIYEDMFA